MAATPSRSSPPEPPLLQDEAAALAESTQVPDWLARAATTSTTEAAKPIHHVTSLVTRTSSPSAFVASVSCRCVLVRLLVERTDAALSPWWERTQRNPRDTSSALGSRLPTRPAAGPPLRRRTSNSTPC